MQLVSAILDHYSMKLVKKENEEVVNKIDLTPDLIVTFERNLPTQITISSKQKRILIELNLPNNV